MRLLVIFIDDLRSRSVNRPQITTDAFRPYYGAIERAFEREVDYAQLMRLALARRKLILNTLLSIWLAWIFSVWCAMVYFGTHRPRTPIPAQGEIYPFNSHGIIVYLTKREYALTEGLWMYYVAVGLMIIVVGNNRGWFREASN